jgi:TonB-dependent SusC/RagA subfamily outer membrane receptor
MRNLMVMVLAAILSIGVASAQSRIITGKVTDSKGDPVAGATVKIKNGAVVVTDDKGNFKINGKTGDELTVTSVDYEVSTTKLMEGTSAEISLVSKNNKLTEVVVTALGIRRSKNTLPYAAQQVSGDDVSRTRGNNAASSLSGKISGLQVIQGNGIGGSTNVVIRGVKSLTGNNQALFVVDGVPIDNSNTNTANQRTGRGGYDYGNAAADINPDDIESINVLKGAAATALYGSRAANGVIMITSKKAKRGVGITINTGVVVGSIDRTTFPTYQKQYGAGYSAPYDKDGFFYFDVNGDGVKDYVTPTTEDASYGVKFDPSLLVYQWMHLTKLVLAITKQGHGWQLKMILRHFISTPCQTIQISSWTEPVRKDLTS